METLIVTRGVVDVGHFIDEGLPEFWEMYIKNKELPEATRKNALTAWSWVWIHPRRISVMDQLSDPRCSRL